jgi:hypothetical protein
VPTPAALRANATEWRWEELSLSIGILGFTMRIDALIGLLWGEYQSGSLGFDHFVHLE